MFLALAICVTQLVPSALADEGSRLRGTVSAASKTGIDGATVTLNGSNNTFMSLTSAHGGYIFLNLPPGSYELTVAKPGYAPIRIDAVTLDLNEVRVLNTTMQTSAAIVEPEILQQTRTPTL